MIGFKIKEMKEMFLDRKAIVDAVDSATRRVLSKFGAFVRTAARTSIRPAGKKNAVSLPGQPPRSHVGLLRQFIFFGYDSSQRSVVIGPARLNTDSGEIPHILEYGGTTIVKSLHRGKLKLTPARIEPRPFMGPALQQELPKLPAMWRDSVKAF